MAEVFITHLASFLPNAPVCNDEMERVLGQVGPRPSRARRTVLRSNGIQQRYYAIDPATGISTHSNAQLTAAAVRALQDSEFRIAQIDCLSCGTTMPDQLMPNHAVMVHGELQTPPCEVVATAGVCLSGLTALKYAWLGVKSGEFSCAVATGSEVASAVMRGAHFINEIDSRVAQLEAQPEIAFEKDFLRWMLSDGAGAMALKTRPRKSGLSFRIDWIIERSYANEMPACMYAGAEKNADGSLTGWKSFEPTQWLAQSVFAVKQDVKQLNEHIIHFTVERALAEIIDRKQLQADQIDWYVPHYSSQFFRDKVYQGMVNVGFEIPYSRWFSNLAQKGNTGSASIYLMLDDLWRSGNLRVGQRILCYVPESGRFSTGFMHLTVVDAAAENEREAR
jgi:3-oxoacyl-[acyl-carrier-protein] synthase-3